MARTATRKAAETRAAQKAAQEPKQETAQEIAAVLAEPGTPAHDKLVTALTAPEYAYGVTKYSATKHYLQPQGRATVTLCTGQAVNSISRGGEVAGRKLCAKCAKQAETGTPVTVDAVNWDSPEHELIETTPAPEAKPEAAPKPEAKPETTPAPEAKPETKPEAKPEPVVLPEGTTAKAIRAWCTEAKTRGVLTGREENRYRRCLTRMGAAFSGNTDEAAEINLAYLVGPLLDSAELDKHMVRFGKLYPKLDKSTLNGYVRNFGRVTALYADAVKDIKAWEKAHPVVAK